MYLAIQIDFSSLQRVFHTVVEYNFKGVTLSYVLFCSAKYNSHKLLDSERMNTKCKTTEPF